MFKITSTLRGMVAVALAACVLTVAGCATSPYGGNRNNGGYGTTYGNNGYNNARSGCPGNQCGVVRDVNQVYVRDDNSHHVLGTIIGAVVGGALGNQVGKGNGRKAATVAGAVAGGAAGHEIAKRENNGGNSSLAWRVIVRLNDGRTATVTQRDNPNVRIGERVEVRNGHVYAY